jgi:hypothetical protein
MNILSKHYDVFSPFAVYCHENYHHKTIFVRAAHALGRIGSASVGLLRSYDDGV